MTHRVRLVLLFLVTALVVATVPAHAQESPYVFVPPVTAPADQRPAPLLPPEEIATIQQLQQLTVPPVVVSEVSPDGQVVLVLLIAPDITAADGVQLGLLNLIDNSISLLPPDIATTIFTNSLSVLSNLIGLGGKLVWADNATLADIAIPNDLAAGTGSEGNSGVLFFNRVTNEVRIQSLPSDIQPVGLSPNGARLLVTIGEPPALATTRVSLPRRSPTNLMPPHLADIARAHGLDPATTNRDTAHLLQVTAEPSRLGVYDVFTGALTELFTVPTGSTPVAYGFSPDSGRLTITLTNVVDRSSNREELDGALLTSLVYQDVTGQLPPAENPIVQNSVLYDFDLTTGERRELRPNDNTIVTNAKWSPDGQTLRVQVLHGAQHVGRPHPVYTLQFVDRASYRFYDANLQLIGELDNPLVGYSDADTGQWFSPDEVLFNVPNGTNYHLWYYNLRSGEFRNVTAALPGTNLLKAVSPLNRSFVFWHTNATAPLALYKLRLDGSGLERLSWENAPLEEFNQSQVTAVSFTLADGAVREGFLVQPAGAPFPPQNERIIVWQQGGPVGPLLLNQWNVRPEDPYSLLPNFGMSVLVVPLVGRRGTDPSSYRAMADGNNFGQRDVDEMAEIVRQIQAAGWTSPAKTGITGCSYGGYFTLQSVVRHSELYAAAHDQCSLVDLYVEWTRGFDVLIPYLVATSPFEDPQRYLDISPVYNAERITTPLLTFKGDQDFLPATLSRNLTAQLLDLGRTARYVEFAEEGHGLAAPQNALYGMQEQIHWFRTHLAE